MRRQYSESKSSFKRRMEALGKWTEAVKFREAERARLQAANPTWTRTEASQEAWQLMMDRYPMAPGEIKVAGSHRVATVGDSRRAADSPVDLAIRRAAYDGGGDKPRANGVPGGWLVRMLDYARALDTLGTIQDDVEWVYQNLAIPCDEIDVETCPSTGAIQLLNEAKVDSKWFYATYHAKLLPTKAQVQSENWFEGDMGRLDSAAKLVLNADELAKLGLTEGTSE